ncbi:MAG: antitoxin AF2212-like protein [Euryarchaeota archaeon]|nr:antitoxin AF2212-like protein [Euryarchaeota archaeon]
MINKGIRAKARYEDKVLKHLEELGLEEGEEVEIETLFGAIEIEVPDSGDMLEANRLQNTPEEFLERYFPNIFVRIKDAMKDILKEG